MKSPRVAQEKAISRFLALPGSFPGAGGRKLAKSRETKNFGLRWYIDLTGEIITKIMFAPNGKDLLVLTTTAKLKYLRINPILPDVEIVREQFGVTDLEPTDFITSPNNKFIIFSGKDGHIKVYDYFMRG